MKKENLNNYYQELLSWLEYEGRPSERIWHPLFYRYPWGLRFELGIYELDDTAEYVQSAKDRGLRIWQEAFAPEDEVLLIFNTTPDRDLKQELKSCRMQRVRARLTCAVPGEDDAEDEPVWFHRYLYAASARDIPFESILKRIVEENTVTGGLWRYGSSVYFYNRTRKLLYHPYDDRGADLICPDRQTLRPYYERLYDLLLSYNRSDIDRRMKVRSVYLRVLLTTEDPERIRAVREELNRRLRGAQVLRESCQPYWKTEGWSELSLTIDSTRPLKDIQYRLAGKWESDTASADFFLPDVGFLWVSK